MLDTIRERNVSEPSSSDFFTTGIIVNFYEDILTEVSLNKIRM
jgi:hypothetical protein